MLWYDQNLYTALFRVLYSIIKRRFSIVRGGCLDSNFILMDSKKFGFRNFNNIIRFAIKMIQKSKIWWAKSLNLMSQSNCVYHFPDSCYYAWKFQFRNIDFLRNPPVTSIFRILTHFPNFLESIGIKFESNQCKIFKGKISYSFNIILIKIETYSLHLFGL